MLIYKVMNSNKAPLFIIEILLPILFYISEYTSLLLTNDRKYNRTNKIYIIAKTYICWNSRIAT